METQPHEVGPVEPDNVTPQKKKKLYAGLGLIAVLLIAAVGYFLLPKKSQDIPQNPVTTHENPQPKTPTVQGNSGSPVDHATYLQIQELMGKTQLAKSQVIESSLRSFDIDDDGDEDILGFIKLTVTYDSEYLFSTWHRTPNGFVYYQDSYYSFRLSEQYDGGLACSIFDLAVGKVTLDCSQSGQQHFTTLRYKEKGGGYYMDVDANAVSFKENSGWLAYTSKKSGIQFRYPSDVQISEKSYAVYRNVITIITAQRNGQTLFEIKTVPQKENGGGGVIALGQRTVFLKLSDASYLSRDWLGGKSRSQDTGVFYQRAHAYQENNVGSVFESYDVYNIAHNRSYVLFTPLTTENSLKEIDSIFSSIQYTEGSSIGTDSEAAVLPSNSISLNDAVTLQVPGYIAEHQPAQKEPGIIVERDLELTFIQSPIFKPRSLVLKLLPFDTVGDVNAVGGGGYNADKNTCFGFQKNDFAAPKKIGANQTCGFGYGDGGFSSQGYYILDSKHRYILELVQTSSDTEPYESLPLDLKSIAESVQFNP